MSSVLTSTVSGAVGVLMGHLQTVATNLPALSLGVYLGPPQGNVANNYVMLGDYPNGTTFLASYHCPRVVLGIEKGHMEDYQLVGHIQCWSGSWDPTGTIDNAFAVAGQLGGLIEDDWTASGTLGTQINGQPTGVGSWSLADITQLESGPSNVGGWGVVLGFTVQVTEAWIQPIAA